MKGVQEMEALFVIGHVGMRVTVMSVSMSMAVIMPVIMMIMMIMGRMRMAGMAHNVYLLVYEQLLIYSCEMIIHSFSD